MTRWIQREILLSPKPRGFHLITHEVVEQLPALRRFTIGLAHLFLKHTSASLAVNEGVEPEARADLEAYFNRLAPDDAPYYTHTYEGPDDMPAHIKAVLIGSSLTLPVTDGALNLGMWQGIYLCEHRNRGGARRLMVTISGVEQAS